MTSKQSTRQSCSQSAVHKGWELLCICVEHSDYWRAVSGSNTHPDVQQPSKASPGVCQEEEGERKCVSVCVCPSMCVCLSLQEVERCGCRSIIISSTRTGSSPNSDSPQTHTHKCVHKYMHSSPQKQSIHLVTLCCSPSHGDSPTAKATHTHTYETTTN